MNRRQLADWFLRLAIAYAAMVLLAGLLGTHYGELLLPAFRAEIHWICSDFRIMGFELIEARGESRFGLVAMSIRHQVIEGTVIPAGAIVSGSTLLGHSLQHPVLMFSLLIAWPGIPALRRIGVCVLALPFLLLVECLDVPVVLGGNVLASMVEQVAPQTVNASPMVQWIDFLGGGGRIVISLMAAVCALFVFRLVEAKLLRLRDPPSPYTLVVDPR